MTPSRPGSCRGTTSPYLSVRGRVVAENACVRGGRLMAATAEAPTQEEILAVSESRGIGFYFAQFVDLYARPSAKLVPAANLSDLMSEGAGFAGFAAGEVGQLPSDPDMAAIPDLRS